MAEIVHNTFLFLKMHFNFKFSEISSNTLLISSSVFIVLSIMLIVRIKKCTFFSFWSSHSKKSEIKMSAVKERKSKPTSNKKEEQNSSLHSSSILASSVAPEIEEYLLFDDDANTLSKHDVMQHLETKYQSCTKNPDHAAFISIKDFKMTDLPDDYQNTDIYKLIKTMVDLTVLLIVKHNNGKNRGHHLVKQGTGWICSVLEHENETTCPCSKCSESSDPSHRWGEINVWTSSLVVSHTNEAKTTTCTLFYNDQESKCMTIDFFASDGIDKKNNISKLKFVTCNDHLIKQLRTIFNKSYRLHKKVNKTFFSKREKDKFTCIVSHIHGQPKVISLGKRIKRSVVSHPNCYTELTKYTYSNATCPGSTGAYVYVHCSDNGRWSYEHFHCGVDACGNNCSGTGKDYNHKSRK